jgi:hypothetical protein
MKLFGIYLLTDIPNLEQNHRRFAEINNLEYKKFDVRTYYEKWALVYHLLESHPGETLVFIDAFSYFVSPDFDLDLSEPITIQELHGKVMDNFFVVRSCRESLKVFHEVECHAAHRFTWDGSFLFEVALPKGIAKSYGYQTQSGKRFNLDLGYSDRGRFFSIEELPIGLGADHETASEYRESSVADLLVAKCGNPNWPRSQLWTEAEIICKHRPKKTGKLAFQSQDSENSYLEIINPGKSLALVTLSCQEPELPTAVYADVSEQNFRRYAERQGLTLYLYKDKPPAFAGLHSTWVKPYILLRHLRDHENVSWIDSDILISDDFLIIQDNDVVVYKDPGGLFNAGFMAFRNSEKAIDFLHAVIARCEAIEDRSTLFVNGGDQRQFIEEYLVHFPDSLPRSNLVANIPTVLDKLREPGPGLWHFMGLNPPSIRAIVMDYYNSRLQNDDEL